MAARNRSSTSAARLPRPAILTAMVERETEPATLVGEADPVLTVELSAATLTLSAPS